MAGPLSGSSGETIINELPTAPGYVPEGDTLVVPAQEQLLVGDMTVDGEIELRDNSSIHTL